MQETHKHYNEKYFNWQSEIGDFGGWANQTKFLEFLNASDHVLDFGCGGGALLKGLPVQEKRGVEINPAAREKAGREGLTVYKSINEVPDGWADVIISNHALEHCERPLDVLRDLRSKVRPHGRVVFVVPCETILYSYRPNDLNQHLYTWSPMCLGNLFTLAGFEVTECEPYIHKWPPNYEKIAKLGGRAFFDLCCKIYARWDRTSYQVRLVGRNPPV